MPRPRPLLRVYFLAGLVLLVDLAVLILALIGWPGGDPVASRNDHEDGGAPPPVHRAATPIQADPVRARLPSPAPTLDPTALTFDPDGLQVRRFERVSRALELLRFPPDSQPLRPDMLDVLRPGARYETPLPLSDEQSLLFTANTYAVGAGSPIIATLEVLRAGRSEGRRAHVDIRSCALGRFAQPDYRPIESSLPLNDDGHDGDLAAGDGVYTLSFIPSAMPDLAAYNGLLRLDVELVTEGGRGPVRAALDFRLTSAPPARFIGVVGERLTSDGLELFAELEVQKAGHYFVQGLLFDANDRPIGVAVARPSLDAGRARVPLLYWGLLFHEANAAAPFTFRTLTGHRLPDAGEPDRSDLATWESSYRTRSYALRDFSDKEHESAAKSRKVQALGELAAHGTVRESPRP